MSIIQSIREKYAAVSIIVIAVSLVGFILMDALSSRTGLFNRRGTSVGTINGKKIDIRDFEARLNAIENIYQTRGMNLSEEQRHQLNNSVWEQMIDEAVMNAQYEKLGLTFSSSDLSEALYGENSNSPLRQQFTDQNTGQFNQAAAADFIRSLKRRKPGDAQRVYVEQQIIDPTIQAGLKRKYNLLLSGSAFYPKWLAEKENADNNALANISYVSLPYSTIADSTITVSDAEINDYVEKHKNEYKQKEQRTISYVLFDASPSSSDSAKVFNQELALKDSFAAAQDAAAFLNINGSVTPLYDGYIAKGKLQVPNADSIMQLKEGEIFGPYLDGGNYTMAKMLDEKTMPDSVQCRHILIGTVNSQTGQQVRQDSVAHALCDSIANVIRSGGNFSALAAQYSDDPGSKNKGGEYKFSSSDLASLAKEFGEFIFEGKKGDNKVVKTSFGWHYIEIMNQWDFGPAYKIAYMARRIDPSDETINSANTAATQFAAQARSAKEFEAAATSKNIFPRSAELNTTDDQIIGLGSARRLVRWAFENDPGTVSEPENFGDKYIVALITSAGKEGLPSVSQARPLVESAVRNHRKAEEIKKKIGNSTNLDAIASANKTSVRTADSIAFANNFIPGVGPEAKVIGAAFNPSYKNKVSPPIEGQTGVFVIRTESVFSKPNENLDYNVQRSSVEQNQKSSISYKSTEALKKLADVKDRRINFY